MHLEITLLKLLPYLCLRSQWFNEWFNSLGPSDAIWRQRSGSTLAQVMACCLTAPSHYLNQCWLIISKVQWHASENNFMRDTLFICDWSFLKIDHLKFYQNPPGANELKMQPSCFPGALPRWYSSQTKPGCITFWLRPLRCSAKVASPIHEDSLSKVSLASRYMTLTKCFLSISKSPSLDPVQHQLQS